MDAIKSLTEVFEQFNEEDVARIAVMETKNFMVSLSALPYVCDDIENMIAEKDQASLAIVEKVIDNAIEAIANALKKDDPDLIAFVWRRATMLAKSRSEEYFSAYEFQNPFGSEAEKEIEPNLSRQWKWPVTKTLDAQGKMNGYLHDLSALKLFGYTVGSTNGWPQRQRLEFLKDFMEADLPRTVTELFNDDYGDPLTAKRLRKVANVISNNIRLRRRNDPAKFRAAIADWESDLAFLKREYYEARSLKFHQWPDTKSEH